MTAPQSVIRCWRPSASSPPAGWPPPARRRRCTRGCWNGRWARPGQRRRPWAAPAGQRGPAACRPDKTAFAPPCRGRSAAQEPEAGRELAARLARWWIATGRYSEAGQFLTTAAGIPAAAAPGIQARVLLGAAWSAYHLGDNPASSPARRRRHRLVPGRPANRSWKSGAATCWPAWPGTRAMRTGSSPRSKPAGLYPARPIRRSRRGPRSCWPTRPSWPATWPSRTRHGLLAIELARTAAGQEGLALALTMPGRCPRSPERASSPPPWPRSMRPRPC